MYKLLLGSVFFVGVVGVKRYLKLKSIFMSSDDYYDFRRKVNRFFIPDKFLKAIYLRFLNNIDD